MSRKKFIESHGATCANWAWSWSFVNANKKFVIFGASVTNTKGDTSLILSEKWEVGHNGKKNNGFPQSINHIKLVTDDGYDLYTFPIIYAEKSKEDASGPASIKSIIKVLSKKNLYKEGDSWYATGLGIDTNFPDEIHQKNAYEEGAVKQVSVNAFERNSEARDACIKHHGLVCAVCAFDFRAIYGEIGAGYIHVHHIVPLNKIRKKYRVNPTKDLIPVCPNCHAMIHRNKEPLSVKQLKNQISKAKGA